MQKQIEEGYEEYLEGRTTDLDSFLAEIKAESKK